MFQMLGPITTPYVIPKQNAMYIYYTFIYMM